MTSLNRTETMKGKPQIYDGFYIIIVALALLWECHLFKRVQEPPVQIAKCDRVVIAGREEDGERVSEIDISLKNLNSEHTSSSSPAQPTLLNLSKSPHLDFIPLEKESLQEAACVPLVFLSKARREGMLKLSRWLGNCPPLIQARPVETLQVSKSLPSPSRTLMKKSRIKVNRKKASLNKPKQVTEDFEKAKWAAVGSPSCFTAPEKAKKPWKMPCCGEWHGHPQVSP